MDDIVYQTISPLLDLQSLISFHMTSKHYNVLLANRVHELKPYYLNGYRYRKLEKLREEYHNAEYTNMFELYLPAGLSSWHRIDKAQLTLSLTLPTPTKTDIRSIIADEWFDLIQDGDVLADGHVILEKSKYTKTQIRLPIGIVSVSPIEHILIPPRTDILIETI